MSLALLVVAAAAALFGPLLEARLRAPEGVARMYLRAVESGDLDAALMALDPAQREDPEVRERVALQLGNRYEVVTLVLGQPSVWDRIAGRSAAPAWATIDARVTTLTGDRWRSTSTAPLVQRDGAWYLSAPLFA